MTVTPERPPAWAILEHALTRQRPVRARYQGHERLLCPHALGWKHGRAKVLAYQADGPTSQGDLPIDPRQRWRSLYIDQIHDPVITTDAWHTADNFSRHTNGIDHLKIAVPHP